MVGTFVALEAYGWRQDQTFSHWFRDRVRTDTRAGRISTVALLSMGSSWLLLHFLDPEDNWLSEVLSGGSDSAPNPGNGARG